MRNPDAGRKRVAIAKASAISTAGKNQASGVTDQLGKKPIACRDFSNSRGQKNLAPADDASVTEINSLNIVRMRDIIE